MKRGMLRASALVFCSGLACLLAGCVTMPLNSEAAHVRAYFQDQDVRNCAYLGEVVGSEGHWYNAWFIANDVLMNAALNDMRNQAHAKGADTLFIARSSLYFKTSVTMLGQAYRCQK